MGLGETIIEEIKKSMQNCAKAIVIYFTIYAYDQKLNVLCKISTKLWHNLKEMNEHQKAVILQDVRGQDFKAVSEHNSALSRIRSQSKWNEDNITKEDILAKTLSAFMPREFFFQNTMSWFHAFLCLNKTTSY